MEEGDTLHQYLGLVRSRQDNHFAFMMIIEVDRQEEGFSQANHHLK